MKQLSSVMVLNINGGYRISYTYDEIDEGTGELVSSNNKGSFFAVHEEVKSHIDVIESFIRAGKLDVTKQLSSFMVLNIDGTYRISYIYNEIDGETGELVSPNNKGNFYVIDEEVKGHIDAIESFIRTNKLEV